MVSGQQDAPLGLFGWQNQSSTSGTSWLTDGWRLCHHNDTEVGSFATNPPLYL